MSTSSIEIEWERWNPCLGQDRWEKEQPFIRFINSSLQLKKSNGKGNPLGSEFDMVSDFYALWHHWWHDYPEACVLATLTQAHGGWGNEQLEQLRFWLTEPASYSARHVDSCGHGLILTIRDTGPSLLKMAEALFKPLGFVESMKECEGGGV